MRLSTKVLSEMSRGVWIPFWRGEILYVHGTVWTFGFGKYERLGFWGLMGWE